MESNIRQRDAMIEVNIPGGKFLMGSSKQDVESGIELCRRHYQPCNRWFYEQEYPQHEVTLSPYVIDVHEVTNQQFQLCVEAGSCQQPLDCRKGESTYLDPDKADHPVVCVDWQSAADYCEWVGSRLPSEAEWEFAARGPEGRNFPWGEEFIGSKLNYCDENCDLSHADSEYNDGYPKTSPVENFNSGKSWGGVFGLGGNVAEWVGDWYGDYSLDALYDPSGPEIGTEKLIKGSSWYFPPVYSRGANRGSTDPDWKTDYLGFRCARGFGPVIDGSIQPGEWEQAEVYVSENGSELLLINMGEHLYIALKANPPELVSGNIFIFDGEKISILHTSAALGTMVYQQEGDIWRQTQDFVWCCRSRADNESARSLREGFYETDGWLGINSFNGVVGELEYMIRLTGEEISLAVNITSAESPEMKQVWPAGITDGPTLVLQGEFPEEMDYSPEFWINLEEIR